MGYHYLNVRISSINDACILCKNFVNFGPVTPEKMGLICELAYLVKYLGIYWTDFKDFFTI